MTHWWQKALALLTLVGVALGAGAAGLPGQVSARDARSVRAVVQAQLDAFGVDDAERAFALASPTLRKQFGSAGKFIDMVRAGYPVVYRPASVAFMVPETNAGELTQAVRMTDARGTLWLAVYRMQRQPDKSWRIAGCEVAEIEGRAA